MLLSRVSSRVTRDVDVVAGIIDNQLVQLERLPTALAIAAADVGRQLGLPANWLNAGPAGMTRDPGLPSGFLERTERRDYEGLVVRLAGRIDMISFKVFAAADHYGDPANKHLGDLNLFAPSAEELASAEVWCRSQDQSPGFAHLLEQVLAELGRGNAE
jgi:hypothetical protein